MQMEKYDIHLHLTHHQLPPLGKMKVSSAKNMLPHLDELGIRKGVLMSSGEGRTLPVTTNKECAAIAAEMPDRFAWMCNVDPVHPETLSQRLAACKAQGAVGVGEIAINERLDSPFLKALLAAASENGLPVLFHMSPKEHYNYGVVDLPGLPLLEESLQAFPDLIFIGHSQPFWHEISGDASDDVEARNSWGSGPVVPGGRVSQLLDKYPNLYCDLSANSGGQAIMRDEAFGLAFLEKYKDRLMFGTDMTHVSMTFPLGEWMETQCDCGKLSESCCRQIFKENAQRILGI